MLSNQQRNKFSIKTGNISSLLHVNTSNWNITNSK